MSEPSADLSGMTLEQLEEEFRQLAAQLVPIENRRALLAKEIDARKKNAAVRSRLRAMPPGERDALRAVLNEEAKG